MNKLTLLLIVVMIGVAGYTASGPFITIHQIREAIEASDSEALSEKVDFSALKISLKHQINMLMMAELASEIGSDLFAALGMVFVTKLVDGMVDLYVTPTGLTNLMSGDRPTIDEESLEPMTNSNPFEDVRYTYDNMSKFSAWVPSEDGGETRFVFSRHGLTWKLSNIIFL